MRELGRVASGRPYELPHRWFPVDDETLHGALDRALTALRAEVDIDPAHGLSRLERYFDPSTPSAGATFNGLDRGAGAVNRVTASDLLAVTLLDVTVEPEQVRQLLEDHPKRATVTAALAEVPRDVALADFGSGMRNFAHVLTRLHGLYSELRTTPAPTSNQWVFASKLCARKLPHLMPVRDDVVCGYLAGKLLDGTGGLGHFEVDLQVFAFLMTHPQVRTDLKDLEARLRFRFGIAMGPVPALRILDVVLWMAGIDAGLGRRPRPASNRS
jgi:hypothetical protein